MAYGTVKVDNVTFTYNAADATTTFSGFYASTTNNLTLSGTASAATFTGTTANFTNVNAQNISVTTALSGLAITGGTAGFTTVTGTTVTGTTANFVSGVFTTQISGVTITGTTVSTTTGNFISLTGTTATITSGIIASGTAALPSLAILSDPNTGIYSPGADQLAISTGGSGRLFVEADGDVCIGQNAGNSQLTVKGSTSTRTVSQFIANDTNTTTMSVWERSDGAVSSRLIYDGTGLIKFGTSTAHALTLDTNNTEKLRITSTGDLNFKGAGTAGSTQAVSFNGSAPVNSLVIDSSGRLGVGSSSPSSLLHLSVATAASDGTKGVRISNPAGTAAMFECGSSNDSYVGTTSASHFSIRTNNTSRIYVTDGGNVGIGSTTLTERLHVNGGVRLDVNDQGLYFNSSTTAITGNGTSSYIAFNTSNAEKARLDSSGRWLVGTSTAETWYASLAQIQYNGSEASFMAIRNSANTEGGGLYLGKSRGTTPNSATVVQSGDSLGAINFLGADGTDVQTIGAQIKAEVDGTPGANDMPGRLVFSTTADGASSPTERMRIDNAGILKVSNNSTYAAVNYHQFNQNASSQWTLGVLGRNATDPYGIRIEYTNAAPNGTVSQFLYCVDTAGVKAEIRSNGGLANFQANNVNLSDRNAKKDISLAAGTWDCLKQWEIVNYRYKDQPDDADLNLGVIAQQVAESCPEVITVFEEAKDDQPEKLGVKEQQMYWMAIKALQEAQVRIETLEAKVAALESA